MINIKRVPIRYRLKTFKDGFLLRFIISILAILMISGCAIPTTPPPFGRNKVITKQYDWYVAKTPHFEIYYYPKIEELIPDISKILEETYQKVTDTFDYEPLEKTPIFIYASHNDFEQTNITDFVGEGVGGFSEMLKNRLVIPLVGSEKDLEYLARHEYTHIITFEILYGGFWKSVRLLKSVFYPYWFMEGIAEYNTDSWDTYADMLVRDASISNQLISLDDLGNFAHLESDKILLAYKQSWTFIKYIADVYGKDKIVLLPFEFKDRFDSNSIIYNITKKDIFRVNKEWHDFLKTKYLKEAEGKKEPGFYGKQLTQNESNNTNPTLSPDATRIAFISDRNNYYDVLLMNADGSKVRSLLKNKISRRIDIIDRNGHALSWAQDGEHIAFAAEKNQKDYIYIFNLRNKRLKKIKNSLDSVSSVCFSPDGEKIVFVGMKNGINNLYLVNINTLETEQLNSDPFDDNYPVFSPDGNKVLYVSERDKQLDLFIIDIESRKITQITNTPYDELSPNWYNDGNNIVFISDANGIYNIYTMNSDGKDVYQLTDVKGGNFTPEYSYGGDKLIFTSYRFGNMNIYLADADKLVTEQKLIPPEKKNIEVSDRFEKEESIFISTTPITAAEISKKELKSDTTDQVSLDRMYPLSKGIPYSFKASTDLFYPFLFFSTVDGLYLAVYWQGSELFGNHGIGTMTEYYSADDWLNLQFYYTFRKWRPQFTFVTQIRNESYYNEDSDLIKRSKWGRHLYVSYPFDRFNRVVLGLNNYDVIRKNRTQDDLVTREIENGISMSVVRDITTGEMFDLTRGRRSNFTVYQARKILDGDFEYTDYLLDMQKYATLAKDNIIALRLSGAFSEGPDKQTFYMGGSDAVRGYPRNDYINSKVAWLNTEYRFLIFPKINYHMWYIIPDFYFKSLQGILFIDTGLGWDTTDELNSKTINSLKSSVGVGLRLNTFILEAFPMVFRLDYAKRLDEKHEGVVYFTLGPSF